MNFHALCITGTSATYRIVAEEGFHVIDFTLFRNLSIFTIALLWCLLVSRNPLKNFPWKHKHQLIWRIITGQADFFLLNLAVTKAPLSLIMVFWQTSPFWISIIAFLFLKEPIVAIELVSMLICFGAVVVISLQQKDSGSSDGEASSVEEGDDETLLGLIYALLAAITMAICAVCNRSLKQTHTAVICFFHACGGLFMASTYILIEFLLSDDGLRMKQYTGRQFWIATGAATFNSGANITSTIAYQCDSSGFVSLISYMNIVYAYICDQIIFHEVLNSVELIAAIVIFVTAIGIAAYKPIKQK